MTDFHIPIEPEAGNGAAAVALANLRKLITGLVNANGRETCATFGQVLFHGNGTDVRGQVFTGDALLYLKKHLDVAVQMQAAQAESTHSPTEPAVR